MESQGMSHPAGANEGLMVGMPVRYVILHHTGVENPHYDFMLDVAGREKLLTWRIEDAPETWAELPPWPERIGDHRRHYLTYEGVIEGNRGEVKRVAEGNGRILQVTADGLRVYLDAPMKLSIGLSLDSVS